MHAAITMRFSHGQPWTCLQWSTGAAKLLFIPTFSGNNKNLLVAVNNANDNVLYLQTIYVLRNLFTSRTFMANLCKRAMQNCIRFYCTRAQLTETVN